MPVTNPTVRAQEDWIAPSLLNNWINVSASPALTPAGYYKDSLGVVHLRGALTGGTIGATMFTLPSGYRPDYRWQFAIASRDAGSNALFGRLDVAADGSVSLGAGGTNRVFLDGVTFRAV